MAAIPSRPSRRHRRSGRSRPVALAGVLVTALLSACSAGTNATPSTVPASSPGAPPAAGSRVATTSPRPDGPVADLTEEITGPGRPFMGSATATEVPNGYEEHEFVATGVAGSYRAAGPLAADGRWSFVPDGEAPYRTRVVVRRPSDPARASGTVVVEWLNVSGGLDANPDYASVAEEITRRGHVWVGVSAQFIGVEGGPVLVSVPGTQDLVGKGLKVLDPARYGSLSHPGDGYAFDVFTQVGRAAAAGGPLTGGVRPDVVLAAGESQSAVALTTYYNGVQPLTRAFDGFLVHSRAFVAMPLVEPGRYADLAGSMTSAPTPTLLRDDLEAPVLELQAESDVVGVLNSVAVRQPDTDRFRLWEVAGTAHADVHLLGVVAGSIDCGAPINDGPMHVVAKAALRALDQWARTGTPPPMAPRLEVNDASTPALRRDGDGIALGGIRTPPVDVPAVVLSGVPGPNPDLLCILLGSTSPLPEGRAAELYPSPDEYRRRYAASVDSTVAAGFALAEDRAALEGYARPVP